MAAAVASQLNGAFVQRMSPHANSELMVVRDIIRVTSLSDSEDKRQSPFCLGLGKLDTSGIYRLIKSQSSSRDEASNLILEKFSTTKSEVLHLASSAAKDSVSF